MNRKPLIRHLITLALASAALATTQAALAQATAAPAATSEAGLAATTPAPGAADCTAVEIHNVRPQRGLLMLAAYGDINSYGKKPLLALRVPAGEAITRVPVCGLSGTEVALMLFQDLDSDGRMGRNLVGLPTEPWGSSGKPGPFGPAWDTGRVPLDGQAIVVRLSQ